MPSVCYVSINTPNPEKTKEFYKKLFGWTINERSMQGFSYWGIENTVGTPVTKIEGSIAQSSDQPQAPSQGVIVYYDLEDTMSVDEFMKKVPELGGAVQGSKMAIPGEGYLAHATDPDGNVFGVWETNENATNEGLEQPTC